MDRLLNPLDHIHGRVLPWVVHLLSPLGFVGCYSQNQRKPSGQSGSQMPQNHQKKKSNQQGPAAIWFTVFRYRNLGQIDLVWGLLLRAGDQI